MSEFEPEVNGNDDKIRDANIPPEKKENLTTSKPEEKKAGDEITDSNLHRPYSPAITYDCEIDDPIWRLGREDGKRGTPPKTGEELFKEASDLLFEHAKANRFFLQLRRHHEENFHQYSIWLGLVFLFIGFVFILGEVALSKNLLEKALEIGYEKNELLIGDIDILPSLNLALTFFLILAIALISAFLKWIWDEVNTTRFRNEPSEFTEKQSSGIHESKTPESGDQERPQEKPPITQNLGDLPLSAIKRLLWRPFFRICYLFVTLLCLYWAYDAFAELRSLTSQIEEEEKKLRGTTEEKLRTNIINELNGLRNQKNKPVKDTFWSFTICFALIGGVFLSEGLRRLHNSSLYRKEEKKWERNHKIYRDVTETISIPPQKELTEIKNGFKSEHQLIYLHGYWRGFMEEAPGINEMCEKLFQLKFLNQYGKEHLLTDVRLIKPNGTSNGVPQESSGKDSKEKP